MGFDRVAGCYQLLERVVYGRALQSARVAQLGNLEKVPQRVLILGDGDGRFLEALLAAMPEAEVEVVEASAKMIGLARRRVGEAAGVTFHHMLFEDFSPVGRFDLVVSHFFLDCFRAGEIEAIIGKIVAVLEDDGSWLISDFQIPEQGRLRRLRARMLLWVMYRFFNLVAGLKARFLVDPELIIKSLGLVLKGRKVSNAGFLRADRWSR